MKKVNFGGREYTVVHKVPRRGELWNGSRSFHVAHVDPCGRIFKGTKEYEKYEPYIVQTEKEIIYVALDRENYEL